MLTMSNILAGWSLGDTVLIGLEILAFASAFGALRNLNPEYAKAGWVAITRVFAPRDAFTPLGWKYRTWAIAIQAVAILWLLFGMPLTG